MPIVLLIVVLLVVGVTAAVALGRIRGGLPAAQPARADHALPPGRLSVSDVAGVRFSVGLRGYRMDEVDEFVDRMLAELSSHAAELDELRAELRNSTLETSTRQASTRQTSTMVASPKGEGSAGERVERGEGTEESR